MKTLFAWANPLAGVSIVDHTWVTDYDITETNYTKPPPDRNYWYCWGDYHSKAASGGVGEAIGDISIASSLAKPNDPPPEFPGKPKTPQDGAIIYYAIDGVCHSVCNQILYATGSPDSHPLRVTAAKGYSFSSFFYGTYGLNHHDWDLLKATCGTVKDPGDDFDRLLKESLGDELTLKQHLEVYACRGLAQVSLQGLRSRVHMLTPQQIKERIGLTIFAAFFAVEKAIGFENFKVLFPPFSSMPSDWHEAISWLDHNMLEHSILTQQGN